MIRIIVAPGINFKKDPWGCIAQHRYYNFLLRSQWYPIEKLELYQLRRLKDLLKYAGQNVPYYSKLFNRIKLRIADFSSLKDLERIPVLTKDSLINNFDKMISKKYHKERHVKKTTSGTTGKPLDLYFDKSFYYYIFRAFNSRRKNWFGINRLNKRVNLWCWPFLEDENRNKILLYHKNNMVLSLSTLPQDRKVLPVYLKEMEMFKADYVYGNPSLLYQLACCASERNIGSIRFRIFLSAFEHLFPYQKDLIEKQFGCRVFNYYGTQERLFSATECYEYGNLHIDMENGIVEIVKKGKQLADGECGSLVATGLHNYIMPLIRYDIGDIASISGRICPCKRGLKTIDLLRGRSNEKLFYNNKYIYSATLAQLLTRLKKIKECQFVQVSGSQLLINVILDSCAPDDTIVQFKAFLRELIGDDIEIEVRFVDSIPRDPSGKFKFIISDLNNQFETGAK
ncbi:MAG: hypothetical protein KKG43_05585 [Candidatus Omnitrophica bacterium]|nr:hypothetical protein [Candidatus Omnitrophota bacterium]MBU1928437.1 hypothetical protein [Candidatus Omnitrophota bacterium]MBU2034319.1 hypothetical protein [Candidatus Omnitrophota bacterium]MBU2221679.1 hypothetical protein [Candidatus Omnitrophota bacterium]MBU2258932.1 hypothetical protein [Candidatus Omnitrophota bacterium]